MSSQREKVYSASKDNIIVPCCRVLPRPFELIYADVVLQRTRLKLKEVSGVMLVAAARKRSHQWCLTLTPNNTETIDHFRVPPRLCFKTRLGAQPSSWKWVLFAREWKMISISQAEHLTSFWNRGLGELGNGLLNEWHVIVFCDQLGETLRAALTELKEVLLIGVLKSLKGLVSILFENKKNGVNRPNLLKGNLACGKFSFLGATRFVSYNMDLQFSRKHLSGNKLYRVIF